MITEEEIKKLDNQNLIAQLISTAHTFGNWVMETQAFADELLCRLEPQVGMPSETLSCEQKFNDYLDEWLDILNKAGKEATTPQERYGEYCKQGLLIIVKDDFNKIFASKS